jgi:tetratricopeptide (TPR) repeat protein
LKNFYEILQVDPNISMPELKEKLMEAQRKWLGRTNAPDLKRRQEAERMVELLQEAEEILLNESKRNEYNRELESYRYNSDSGPKPIIDHNTLDVDALIEEAWKLLERGRTADAIVVGKRATEKSSGNAEAWAVLARAHYMWNEYDDAIYEYKKAIDIEPNNDVFYYDLSDVYLDHERLSLNERLNLAEQVIQKAIKIKPNERAYHFRIAVIARYKENYDQAIDILQKLIQTHGKDPSLGNELALNYYYKCLSKMYPSNVNGQTYYYFISKESAEEGLVLLKEAKIYATDRNLLEEIQTFIDLAERSLKMKLLVGRFLKVGSIPFLWFLIALANFSLTNIIISGLLLYGAWRFSRVPVWKNNREILAIGRQHHNANISH